MPYSVDEFGATVFQPDPQPEWNSKQATLDTLALENVAQEIRDLRLVVRWALALVPAEPSGHVAEALDRLGIERPR